MTTTAAPLRLFDGIPPADAIARRLAETAAERRALRALLRVARLREEAERRGKPVGRKAGGR